MKAREQNIYNNYDEFFNKVYLNNGSVARAATLTSVPVTKPPKAPGRYLKKTRDAWDRFMYFEIDSGLLSLEDLVYVEVMFDYLDDYYRSYRFEKLRKLAERSFTVFDKIARKFYVAKKERDRLKALVEDHKE